MGANPPIHIRVFVVYTRPSHYLGTYFISAPSDLNTLDWSRSNRLAIGLGNSVFLWNASDGSVQQLMEMGSEFDYVSSVSWAGNGKYLAIGGSDAAIQLWDVEKERRVRVMRGHSDRVGVLTWNSHTLTRWVMLRQFDSLR